MIGPLALRFGAGTPFKTRCLIPKGRLAVTGERLSKRKLESYRRAEVVAQAARKFMTARVTDNQAEYDMLIDAVLDWMDATGQVKFAPPVRRSRKNRALV